MGAAGSASVQGSARVQLGKLGRGAKFLTQGVRPLRQVTRSPRGHTLRSSFDMALLGSSHCPPLLQMCCFDNPDSCPDAESVSHVLCADRTDSSRSEIRINLIRTYGE